MNKYKSTSKFFKLQHIPRCTLKDFTEKDLICINFSDEIDTNNYTSLYWCYPLNRPEGKDQKTTWLESGPPCLPIQWLTSDIYFLY